MYSDIYYDMKNFEVSRLTKKTQKSLNLVKQT